MPYRRDWLNTGALLIFFSAALCCAVLGILLLVRDDTKKVGIATLIVRACPFVNISTLLILIQFNITDIHLPNLLVKLRAIPAGSLLQPFQSEVQSAAGFLTTDIPAVTSKIQSAVGAAKTAAIKALLPRNCSLGTKQFCVGFSNHTKYNDLLLNIFNIIPEDVARFVGDIVQAL